MRSLARRGSILPLVLLTACPADDAPSDDEIGDTTTGDGDTTTTGDGDTTSEDESDTTTGDDEGEGEPTYVLLLREDLGDQHTELGVLDITAPEQVGEPELLKMVPAGQVLAVEGQVPFGAWHVRERIGMTSTSSLLDYEGNPPVWSFGPLLPEGVPPHVSEVGFDAEGDDMLVEAAQDTSGPARPWLISFVDGAPSGAVEVLPGFDPVVSLQSVALSPDAGHVAVMSAVEGQDFTYDLQLVELGPQPSAPLLLDTYTYDVPVSTGLHLSDENVFYKGDIDDDGVEDLLARDLADPLAPAVQVSTVVAGDFTIRVRYAADDSKLLYWTGSDVYGELYLVDLIDGQPQAPVLLSDPSMLALTKNFEFEPGGGVIYVFGSQAEGQQGIAHVSLEGGNPAPPVPLTEALAPGAELALINYDHPITRFAYVVADDPNVEVRWLELTADGPTTPKTLMTGFDDALVAIELPPVGRRVVMQGMIGGQRRLLSVDVDDPQPEPTWLDEGLPAGWELGLSSKVSPDGIQVINLAKAPDADDEALLWTAIDGSSSMVQLTPSGWEIRRFEFVQPN